ncbi:RING finger protein [Gregarina niphandrodes]|uniref:RING finger protein n=1 Tax=Gregarina niphandrodes TaxID=110365 RepID=A0A023B430_GRENI|nr:RING finger protein [Gregarina niphandrodes]EZG56141.1 RING finger protein [Gregarina niphandrodes]|eukprot:XP_011131314.1 RING finger protein [Gregarina niphandrodes]
MRHIGYSSDAPECYNKTNSFTTPQPTKRPGSRYSARRGDNSAASTGGFRTSGRARLSEPRPRLGVGVEKLGVDREKGGGDTGYSTAASSHASGRRLTFQDIDADRPGDRPGDRPVDRPSFPRDKGEDTRGYNHGPGYSQSQSQGQSPRLGYSQSLGYSQGLGYSQDGDRDSDDECCYNLTSSHLPSPSRAGLTSSDGDDDDLEECLQSLETAVLTPSGEGRSEDGGSEDDRSGDGLSVDDRSEDDLSEDERYILDGEATDERRRRKGRHRMRAESGQSRERSVASGWSGADSERRRRARVSALVRRMKQKVNNLVSREGSSVFEEPSSAALHRIKRVWVDVDMLPHQARYYALLLLEFRRQINENDMIQSLVQMIAYLRVAANAAEMLPEKLLLQLQLGLEDRALDLKGILADILDDPTDSCHICFDMRPDARINCGHTFHRTCVCQWVQNHDDCPVCKTPVQALVDASPVDSALRKAGNLSREQKICDINQKVPWVLSNKYQRIIDCIEYEVKHAAKFRCLIRFVVVSSFTAMVEGFSRTLAVYGKVPYDVILPQTGKLKAYSILKKFSASLEPRLLLYHAAAIKSKHVQNSHYRTPHNEVRAHECLVGFIDHYTRVFYGSVERYGCAESGFGLCSELRYWRTRGTSSGLRVIRLD